MPKTPTSAEPNEFNLGVTEVGLALRALGPVAVPALSNQVASFIVDAIRSGIFPLGSILPAERILSEELGISRKVVRDALDVLRGNGIIEITRGRFGGSTVVSLDGVSHLLREIYDGKAETLRDLHQVRRILEREACHSAAKNMDEAKYRQLSEILSAAETAFDNFLLYQEFTVQFHIRVGLFSGNPFLAGLIRTIANQISIAGQRAENLKRNETMAENQVILRALLEAMITNDRTSIDRCVDKHIDLILASID